jgi:hypothetical protein
MMQYFYTALRSALRGALVVNDVVAAHRLQVNPVEQPVQLLHGESDDLRVLARPDEAFALEPLVQQPEAVAVPAEQLDPVAPPVGEDVDGGGKRVATEFMFDQCRQPIDGFAKVNRFAVQADREARGLA